MIRELLLKLIAFPAAGCLVLFVASYTASITSPSKAIEPSTRLVQLLFAIAHENFWTLYRPLAEKWFVFDNSGSAGVRKHERETKTTWRSENTDANS